MKSESKQRKCGPVFHGNGLVQDGELWGGLARVRKYITVRLRSYAVMLGLSRGAFEVRKKVHSRKCQLGLYLNIAISILGIGNTV